MTTDQIDILARALYKWYEECGDSYVDKVWNWADIEDEEVKDSFASTVMDMTEGAYSIMQTINSFRCKHRDDTHPNGWLDPHPWCYSIRPNGEPHGTKCLEAGLWENKCEGGLRI